MSPIQQMLLGAGGAVATKTYVDDVFSTFLYKGNGTSTGDTQTINNGIDLSGEGGMVWLKSRDNSYWHTIVDTVRGANKTIYSNDPYQEETLTNVVNSFNNNGFTAAYNSNYSGVFANKNNDNVASWTFRKAKGFFDIVTWTGDSNTDQTISHNLGCIPGFITIKMTSSSGTWRTYHRSLGEDNFLNLDETGAAAGTSGAFAGITSTQFVATGSLSLNTDGGTYVAYLFAGGESTQNEAVSVDFDGSGDYLNVASSSDLTFGTGDFTVEFWANPDDFGSRGTLYDSRPSGGTTGITIGHESSSGQIRVYMTAASGSDIVVQSNDFEIGQWQHIAVTRASGTVRLFINGLFKDSGTRTDDLSNTNSVNIGYKTYTSSSYDYFDGKVSNFRVVKGTALYTSSFRPPTEPLTNITNTKLLCCNNSSTTGSTVTPGTITSNGDPTASTDSPFDDPDGFKFGENGGQNIIKCGSYIGNGSPTGPEINLGWEPQWLLCKKIDNQGGGANTSNWHILDSMRGTASGAAGVANDQLLMPNLSNTEVTIELADFTSTGFKNTSNRDAWNYDGDRYLYVAIRRPDGYCGKPPELGTDVFAMDTGNSSSTIPAYDSGFPVDFALDRQPGSSEDWYTSTRLMGQKWLKTNANSAETSGASYLWDSNVGYVAGNWANSNYQSWMWKRHAGFDVVNYKADNTSKRSIPHSLGKIPEMMWVKNRDNDNRNWAIYHKGLNGGTNPEQYYLEFDTGAEDSSSTHWSDTAPTAIDFTIGNSLYTGENPQQYIALLFASVEGISKVGRYTGDGTSNGSHEITCGFTPRFLIIKCVTSGVNFSQWNLWDSLRGLDGSGSECYLKLNSDGAEVCDYDYLDTTSTGFKLNSSYGPVNGNGNEMIYYAHA